MLKPRQDTPDNMLRAREDKLEKFIDKEDKAEAFTQAEMDYTEDGDIESDDDIGEGFGAQAGEIPEVRTAEVKTLTPSEADKGKRLDAYIGEATDLSRSYAQNLIEDGLVSVSGRKVAKKYKIKAGETIMISIPEAKPIDAAPEDIPIDIIYEDEDVIVVEKPRGMVVHPAIGNPSGTLVNAIMYHCGDSLSSINGAIRPGIVHRIDKDTSGLLMIAKNDSAHESLRDTERGRVPRVKARVPERPPKEAEKQCEQQRSDKQQKHIPLRHKGRRAEDIDAESRLRGISKRGIALNKGL